MGLLDGVLGGVVGAGMASMIQDVIKDHGGIQGIVKQLEANGLGDTVKSWIGTGQNHPVSGEQLHAALDTNTLAPLAAKLGITTQELSAKLAEVLPGAVDKLTPDGVVPATS